jgi:cell division protein FtsL
MVAGWLVLLLAALSLVTWRQTRGVEMERALRSLESQRVLAEADRVASHRRIEELGSRARIVRVARDRLGMHLPEDREIVFLPAVETGALAAAAAAGVSE